MFSKAAFRKLKKDNRGAALAMVMLAIALVTILVSVLMIISYINYQMKLTEKKSKANFYSAEMVLDQINAGLRSTVSNATGVSYTKAMQSYQTVDEDTRVRTFNTSYINMIRKDICEYAANPFSDPEAYYYIGDPVNDFDTTTGLYKQGLLKYLDTGLAAKVHDGSIIVRYATPEGSDPSTYGKIISHKKGLTMKGILVEYTDERGFYTKISTDIAIGFPDISLRGYTVLPNVFNFTLIGDTGIKFASVNTKLKQSAYAGKDGIDLDASKVEAIDTQLIVSKGDINIDNDSVYDMKSGELWAQNLNVQGATAKTVTASDPVHMGLRLSGVNAYVADDLTLKGRNVQAILSGSYYGFGNPALKDDIFGAGSGLLDPQSSSAIILNAKNSVLNMSDVETLRLYGNSYISSKAIAFKQDTNPDINVGKDILLGNSLSVKADQIAYLAPVECLGVVTSATGAKEVVVGRNPMTEEEYNQWISGGVSLGAGETYAQLDVKQPIHLLGKTLEAYGMNGTDYTKNCKALYRYNVATNETIVYIYLTFDDDMAALYYRDYVNAANQKLTDYVKQYHNTIYLNPYSQIMTKGNIYSLGYNGDGSMNMQVIENSLVESEENKTAYEDALKDQKAKIDKYYALCKKLLYSKNSLTAEEQAADRTCFSNIINTDATGPFNSIPSGTAVYEVPKTSGGGNYQGIVTTGNYTVNSNDVRLVIAGGDVTVNCKFDGLIIAKGTITVNTGAEYLQVDKETLTRLLKVKVSGDADAKTVIETYFRNGDRYVLDETGENDAAYVDFEKIIAFENWEKDGD